LRDRSATHKPADHLPLYHLGPAINRAIRPPNLMVAQATRMNNGFKFFASIFSLHGLDEPHVGVQHEI
jgi:hypothetical protein